MFSEATPMIKKDNREMLKQWSSTKKTLMPTLPNLHSYGKIMSGANISTDGDFKTLDDTLNDRSIDDRRKGMSFVHKGSKTSQVLHANAQIAANRSVEYATEVTPQNNQSKRAVNQSVSPRKTSARKGDKMEEYLNVNHVKSSLTDLKESFEKKRKEQKDKPWRVKNNDPNKLRLPLLKGYDDYDRELDELFGKDRERILQMINDEAMKNWKRQKLVTEADIEEAKAQAEEAKAREELEKANWDEEIFNPHTLGLDVGQSILRNWQGFDMSTTQEGYHRSEKDEMTRTQINKFCRPQFLHQIDDLGFSFNVVGVFGEPDLPEKDCIYTCLASLCPPAEPYKPKGAASMLYAHHFFRLDWA